MACANFLPKIWCGLRSNVCCINFHYEDWHGLWKITVAQSIKTIQCCVYCLCWVLWIASFEGARTQPTGRVWEVCGHTFTTMCLCVLVVAQITELGYFRILQKSFCNWILISLLIPSWIFYVVCKRTYHASFAVVPLYVASEISKRDAHLGVISITEAKHRLRHICYPSRLETKWSMKFSVSHPPNYSGIVTVTL